MHNEVPSFFVTQIRGVSSTSWAAGVREARLSGGGPHSTARWACEAGSDGAVSFGSQSLLYSGLQGKVNSWQVRVRGR